MNKLNTHVLAGERRKLGASRIDHGRHAIAETCGETVKDTKPFSSCARRNQMSPLRARSNCGTQKFFPYTRAEVLVSTRRHIEAMRGKYLLKIGTQMFRVAVCRVEGESCSAQFPFDV